MFRFRILQLFRNSIERPLKIGRRQIDAPAVNIRAFVAQPIGMGADDAAINDMTFEVIFGEQGRASARLSKSRAAPVRFRAGGV